MFTSATCEQVYKSMHSVFNLFLRALRLPSRSIAKAGVLCGNHFLSFSFSISLFKCLRTAFRPFFLNQRLLEVCASSGCAGRFLLYSFLVPVFIFLSKFLNLLSKSITHFHIGLFVTGDKFLFCFILSSFITEIQIAIIPEFITKI